ncbi:MAG TPA: asparagine synthase [Candidatus Altiarchaeales archaeon]|nr:asparagine synthase [Candidatus Altiarchaeales archaeon]
MDKKFTETLIELLSNAVKKECKKEPRVGIVLSGGIDSTLIAIIASKFTEVTAYTYGIKGSPDFEYADKLKKEVDFNIKIQELNSKDIEGFLPKIIKAINNTNPVKVSVEVPFYYASKKAREDFIGVMLCGQGADELFGGYKRYIDILARDGYGGVERVIKRDVENIWIEQLDYDHKVCSLNRIDLRFPYMDTKFSEHAMQIPVELKIYESDEFECIDSICGKKFVRKYILRKVAQEVGVPPSIINRKKKAAQYGSGAWKILEKIAREKNFKKRAREIGRTDYVNMFLESIV